MKAFVPQRVWPEGSPEKARVCNTRLSFHWAMLGPFGLKASLQLKRMCYTDLNYQL